MWCWWKTSHSPPPTPTSSKSSNLLRAFLAVQPAPHGKPGLWNITTTMQMAMPQLPPEAMAMMKSRGIKLPGIGGEPVKTQICMTEEEIDKDAISRM